MDAIVKLGDAFIHYNISREANGIYQARLVRYEGCPTEEPPRELVLTRGYRCWRGSMNHPMLLHELGKLIDTLSLSNEHNKDNSMGKPATS
jgi:hypothetical protein